MNLILSCKFSGLFAPSVVLCCTAKDVRYMAQITVEEIYRGDKYGVLGKVIKDLFECGLAGKDLHTRIEY